MLTNASGKLERLKKFLTEDMWLLDIHDLPKLKQVLINATKMVYIVAKGYVHDNCTLHASALAFITLLSVIPVLALSMSIADLMGFGSKFTEFISQHQENVPPHVQRYIIRITEWVQQTDFLALGIIGVFFLLWIYIRAMWKLEMVMDSIWGVKSKRRVYRRISLYVGLMFLVTTMFVVATSVMAAIPGREFLAGNGPEVATTAYEIVIQNLSILGIIAALSALYILLPNTRVATSSAMAGAVTAGLLWLAWQKICIHFQIGITNYNKFYGAFASIPLVLYWMYVNWIIILLGAEISFAWQNFKTFSLEMESDDVSQALRRRLAFHVVYDVCRCYKKAVDPTHYWNSRQFQARTKVPVRLLNNILEMLKNAGLVVQLSDGEQWVPGRDIHQITMKDVEVACRGAVDGKFKHIGRIPAVVADILKKHELSYFEDLSKRNLSELIDTAEASDNDDLKEF